MDGAIFLAEWYSVLLEQWKVQQLLEVSYLEPECFELSLEVVFLHDHIWEQNIVHRVDFENFHIGEIVFLNGVCHPGKEMEVKE